MKTVTNIYFTRAVRTFIGQCFWLLVSGQKWFFIAGRQTKVVKLVTEFTRYYPKYGYMLYHYYFTKSISLIYMDPDYNSLFIYWWGYCNLSIHPLSTDGAIVIWVLHQVNIRAMILTSESGYQYLYKIGPICVCGVCVCVCEHSHGWTVWCTDPKFGREIDLDNISDSLDGQGLRSRSTGWKMWFSEFQMD